MKQTKPKRLLSLVIAAMMILTLIPFSVISVSAAPGGSGTAEDPYIIGSKEDWEHVAANAATYASSYLKLTADIVATTEGETLSPLTSTTNFSGTLDGDGHTVKGFRNVQYQKGFICNAQFNGTVKNITFENMTMDNSLDQHTGLLARTCGTCALQNINVKNCTVSTTVDKIAIGGLIGRSYYSGGITATNVKIDGLTLSAPNSNCVGGIIGTIFGAATYSFTNCSVSNSTINGENYVGAFIGGAEGYTRDAVYNFTNCESLNNTVSGGEGVALVVGSVGNVTTVNATSCNVSGNVTASSKAASGFYGTYKITDTSKGGGYRPTYTFDNVSVQGISDTQPTTITCTGTDAQYAAAGALMSETRGGDIIVRNNSRIENVQISGINAGTISANAVWGHSNDGTLKITVSDTAIKDVAVSASGYKSVIGGYGGHQPCTHTCTGLAVDNVVVTDMEGNSVDSSAYLSGGATQSSLSGITIANSGLGEISDFYEQHADTTDYRHYRFAALSTSADRAAYDMVVTATYNGNDYKWDALENTAYDSLVAYSGLEAKSFSAEDAEGEKFIAVVIENAPKAAITFTVSTSYTDGSITWTETADISYDADGTCLNSTVVA